MKGTETQEDVSQSKAMGLLTAAIFRTANNMPNDTEVLERIADALEGIYDALTAIAERVNPRY